MFRQSAYDLRARLESFTLSQRLTRLIFKRSRHPGEGRSPESQALCSTNWTPAFAGVTGLKD